MVSPPCLVAVNKMTSSFFYLVIKIKFIKELNVLSDSTEYDGTQIAEKLHDFYLHMPGRMKHQ